MLMVPVGRQRWADGICEDLRCVCGLSEWFGWASSASQSSASEGEATNATCCADGRDILGIQEMNKVQKQP
jgi:hypothetical protein